MTLSPEGQGLCVSAQQLYQQQGLTIVHPMQSLYDQQVWRCTCAWPVHRVWPLSLLVHRERLKAGAALYGSVHGSQDGPRSIELSLLLCVQQLSL